MTGWISMILQVYQINNKETKEIYMCTHAHVCIHAHTHTELLHNSHSNSETINCRICCWSVYKFLSLYVPYFETQLLRKKQLKTLQCSMCKAKWLASKVSIEI